MVNTDDAVNTRTSETTEPVPYLSPNVPQDTPGVKNSIFWNRENDTGNQKYDITREQGGSADGSDTGILHEIDNGEDSTRAGEQAQRMGESAASLEERRSSCDRIRGTDTVKRRAYETAEEKITLDVIEDTSLPEALQKIADENKSMYGKNTYFFIDDAEVEIDGEMHSAYGFRDENGDIWLSANAEYIYAINDHERFHILYAENAAAADVFANTMLGTLTPEEFDVLMDQYKADYAFLNTDNAVYEEILADIYAGRISLKNSAAVTEAISKLNADPVTYDDSGNVIPLSERFNQQKKDIGYALRGVKAKLPYDRTAILEESTVDKYLSEYAAKSNGKYSNAYIAYMSPDDFLKLTTGDVVGRARVEAESKKLNAEQFRTVTPKDAIRLYIDADTGEVSGHEGRHRMTALWKNGIDRVPVILHDSNNKYGKVDLQDLELIGQFNNNAKITIGQAIPLNYNNRDRIIKLFATRSSMQRIAERTNTRQTLKFSVRSDTESKQTPRQTLDEMARQYGTIKSGETPVRESNLPKKTSKNRFLSQFARTLYEAGSTTEEFLPALESKLAAGDFSYEKIQNSKLAAAARKTVSESMDSAQKIWDGVVENGAMPKADDIALGQTLYNEYVKNGDYDSAIKIASELAVEATRLGQSVQAFRLLKKLTPDGQLYVLERTKNNLKKELVKKMGDKAPDITIDETLAENLLRAKTPQEIESAVDAIKQDIADQMPATFADKVNAWRYLAMLGNPRTHIRNIVGNTIFIPMRALKDLIGAGLEKAVKVEQSKRTKTVLNPIKDKEYIDAGKKSFETVKDILQNTDKYGERDIYNRRRIFNSRFL